MYRCITNTGMLNRNYMYTASRPNNGKQGEVSHSGTRLSDYTHQFQKINQFCWNAFIHFCANFTTPWKYLPRWLQVSSAVYIALSCVHYIRSVHLFVYVCVCVCVCVFVTGTSNFSFMHLLCTHELPTITCIQNWKDCVPPPVELLCLLCHFVGAGLHANVYCPQVTEYYRISHYAD